MRRVWEAHHHLCGECVAVYNHTAGTVWNRAAAGIPLQVRIHRAADVGHVAGTPPGDFSSANAPWGAGAILGVIKASSSQHFSCAWLEKTSHMTTDSGETCIRVSRRQGTFPASPHLFLAESFQQYLEKNADRPCASQVSDAPQQHLYQAPWLRQGRFPRR
jgi:hypothetical protein